MADFLIFEADKAPRFVRGHTPAYMGQPGCVCIKHFDASQAQQLPKGAAYRDLELRAGQVRELDAEKKAERRSREQAAKAAELAELEGR